VNRRAPGAVIASNTWISVKGFQKMTRRPPLRPRLTHRARRTPPWRTPLVPGPDAGEMRLDRAVAPASVGRRGRVILRRNRPRVPFAVRNGTVRPCVPSWAPARGCEVPKRTSSPGCLEAAAAGAEPGLVDLMRTPVSGWRVTTARSDSAIRTERSMEPSSMTMTSSAGRVCARIHTSALARGTGRRERPA
jgi:hypothetical protein